MDGACKEWWYKDKMMGVSKKGYFCLFHSYILTINYRCLKDLLLIFAPRPKTQFSQRSPSFPAQKKLLCCCVSLESHPL